MARSLLSLLSMVALLAHLAVPLTADESTEEARLRDQIQRTMVNLSVDAETFDDVVKTLEVQTGHTILIDPRILADVGEIPVAGLVFQDLPLETVLDLLAESVGEEVLWAVRGRVIIFTHRSLVDPRLEVRLYPVEALVGGRVVSASLPGILLEQQADDESDEMDELRRPLGGSDELIELIQGAVAPEFWEETEGADLRTTGETCLVATASPEVHAGINRFLDHLDQLTGRAVFVEVQAVRSASPPKGTEWAISNAAVAELLASPAAGPALRLAARQNVPSTAFVGPRRTNVRRYSAGFAGRLGVLDPEIGALEGGIGVRVIVFPGPDGKRILLDLEVAVGELEADSQRSAMATELPLLPGRSIARRDMVALVAPGIWHWVEGRAGGADRAGWAILVRATPVSFPQPDGDTPSPAYRVPVPRRSLDVEQPLSKVRLAHVQWENVNLDQAMTYLRAVSGLNFYITPRVRDEMFDEIELNLRLMDASVETVLDLVTEPFELEWRQSENLITIDLRRDRHRPLAIRYFDVKDLVERAAPFGDAENLVELVRESQGGYEDWEDPASLDAREGLLIARNTPVILDAIDRLLGGLRASRRLVVTTVDQIRMSDELALQVLHDDGGFVPPFLSPSAHSAIEAALTDGRATRIDSERIVSLDGRVPPKVTGREVTYVADYDLAVSPKGDAGVMVKQIKTLRSGARVDVRALAGYRSDLVYLEVAVDRTELVGAGTVAMPYGTIALPVTNVWSVSTGLRVPTGKTAVLFASRDETGWQALLVTPLILTLEQE